MARNVEFDILAKDRASQTFDKVGRSASGLGSTLGKLGKGAMVGLGIAAAGAAVGGVAALGGAMIQGVKDAAAYQTLAAKTAAVLKSTGNAAHQSVKGIQARAAALESMSGVDETLIINGQNVLATFTNIRDGVGKGNKIFDQATTAALNMSTALGQDMQSSVVQLGKALNDPIKGITALSRVGVSFTAQQKEQIKTLVKSGDTLGAQKVILKELNKEFGGAAKAAGQGFEGSMARAKDAVQDAFRAIGMKLLPTVTKFANYIATHAGPWIDKLSAGFSRVWAWVSTKLWPALQRGYAAIMPALKTAFAAVVGFIQDKAIPAVTKFVGWIRDDLWPAIQKGYNTIMPALKQAFATVAGAFKSTGKDGESFGDIVKKVGNWVTTVLIPALAWVAKNVLPIVAAGMRMNIEAVKLFWRALEGLMGVVGTVVKFIVNRFADIISGFAKVLHALGTVPGFKWAETAARKLDGVAASARHIADGINNIPNTKNVTVSIRTIAQGVANRYASGAAYGTGTIKSGTGKKPGMRASGGPVMAGMPYVVGEREPELFVPNRSGSILNQKQLAGLGGDTYVFNVSGVVGNEQAVVDKLHALFLAKRRRSGVNLGLA